MGSWRDIKRSARRVVHSTMRLPALYIYKDEAPVLVHVRLHDPKVQNLGDLDGRGASMVEQTPKILFMLDEVDPQQTAIVSLGPGAFYRVGKILPPDDISVSAEVARLWPAEYTKLNLPVPGDA